MDAPTTRVAVVTGGGRGLGRTIAGALADDGFAVAVISRTAGEVEETARLLEAAGGRALALPVDLTVRAEVDAAFARVEETLGPVDLLVNNAGACTAIGPSWEVEPEQWWGDVASNVLTTYLCTRTALPGMTARGAGRIVNLGSESGVAHPAVRSGASAGGGSAAMTAYGSAKSAVHQFTWQLALEVAPFGITVVAIRPGPVRSSMTDLIADRLGLPRETWLPWVDEGQGAAKLICRVARGEADSLNGHYIRSAQELDP